MKSRIKSLLYLSFLGIISVISHKSLAQDTLSDNVIYCLVDTVNTPQKVKINSFRDGEFNYMGFTSAILKIEQRPVLIYKANDSGKSISLNEIKNFKLTSLDDLMGVINTAVKNGYFKSVKINLIEAHEGYYIMHQTRLILQKDHIAS